MAEFLPLCDLLFNVVSLAAYFCDIVFDVLVIYTIYVRQGINGAFVQSLISIVLAMLIIQMLSLYWYMKRKERKGWSCCLIVFTHFLQLGVLWRYARLLMPVRLTEVKVHVRDLCILRLLHSFIQAAPMLLIQLNILATTGDDKPPNDLVTVSASLSLFSVCWGLASFSKHVQDVERLVLTWLGVISQLLWRAGTVTSRALALSAYAASYHSWVFLVLILHWFCMFLWLISPRSAFYGQKCTKLWLCALVSGVYVISYMNLQDKPHVRSMTVFYVVMLLENCLLLGAWLSHVWPTRNDHNSTVTTTICLLLPSICLVLFLLGLGFMLLYYRYFHVQRLIDKPSAPPGVFNCRFGNNQYVFNRKKKMPTTFVPPPGLSNVPFWRRPLPSTSENDGSSVGSRVNIHQKLQEKKQKQLAELKIIEEEIKQGKLVGPETLDPDDRQPIPRAKKHLEPQHLLSLASLNNLASYGVNFNRRPPPRAPRSRTPELLLTPRYLYCDCTLQESNINQEQIELSNIGAVAVCGSTDRMMSGGISGGPSGISGGVGGGAVGGVGHQSDLESQLSLPRSYTLPREFKYYRRGCCGRVRPRKPVRAVASTNSSDGDVDSADNESDYNNTQEQHMKQLKKRPFRHETKL